MKVTNNSTALQGIHTLGGVVFLKPKESRELDLSETQAKRAGRLKFLDLKGEASQDEGIPIPLGPTIDVPPNEIDQLRQQIEAKDAEIKRLEALLEDRDADLAKMKADRQPTERDDLKKQAAELGITDYPGNISNVKLKELIDAKLAS